MKYFELKEPKLTEDLKNLILDEESKDHTIAQIMQKGYKLGSRVLRPARVKVFEYKK